MEELLYEDDRSFNQLLKRLGKLTNKVLAQRLHELESNGLVRRRLLNKKPLVVRYRLTGKGKELMQVFAMLKQWGVKQKIVPLSCTKTNCNECRMREGESARIGL